MRFADLDGSLIDVYQAATQMTDESGMTYATHINTLLDNAIGAPGYYGVVTTNMHTDFANHAGQKTVVNAALARGVPVVSARQMLTWLDGRNGSSFAYLAWNAGTLTFSIAPGAGANGLQAMLPTRGRERLTPGPDARRQPRQHRHPDDQGHRVRGLRRDGRGLRGDVRRRHGCPGDHLRRGRAGGRRHRNGHLDDRRARDLARRLRHVAGSLNLNVDRSGARDLAHGAADRAPTRTRPTTSGCRRRTQRTTPRPRRTRRLPRPPSRRPTAVATDTTVADFSAGTTGRTTYVSETGGGEVILAPTVGAEFGGTSLPSGWSSTPWTGGGGVTVGGGEASRRRRAARDDRHVRPGRSIEFVATFGAERSSTPAWA